MNVAPEALGPARRGADLVPQVLFNHVRVGRGPWRIKAFIDREGRAFTNNYCMVRPRQKSLSLELLWAILNSPLCNAFAFAHATGKHNLPGTIGRMPLPAKMAELDLDIAPLVRRYQEVASEWAGPLSGATDRARSLMLEIDARVLRAYELPPRQEREVLDLFVGRQRAGVPFRFDRYFPDGFESWIPLHEYLSEEYLRSTAGALHATHEDVSSPELLEALRRASEDFEE
jgi:hypothetical protein